MQNGDGKRCGQSGLRKWLALASAYGVFLLDGGFSISTGSLFVAIMEEYEVTRAKAAIVQSTAFAVFMCSGIVSGWIVKRYGARRTGFVGAIMAVVGALASYFATSITHLVVTIGIAKGIASSLMYISSSTAVERHFEGRLKLIVMSILVTGTGVGGIIYPYLLPYLYNMYGLKASFLIVGAILANGVCLSLLWSEDTVNLTPAGESLPTRKTKTIHGVTNIAGIHTATCDSKYKDDAVSSSEIQMIHDKVTKGLVRNMYRQKEVSNEDNCEGAVVPSNETKMSHDNVMVRNKSVEEDVCMNQTRTDLAAMDDEGNSTQKKDAISAFHDCKVLLKNTSFIVFTVALAVSIPTFTIVLIFIVDVFVDKGYFESDASLGLLLLHVVGIVGRLSPGFFMQMSKFPAMGVPMIASFIGCLSILGIILAPVLEVSLVCCGGVGLSYGTLMAMFTVAPTRLAGRERLQAAMGILFTTCGIGNAIVGPVSGTIRDRTNTYKIPFYAAAGCLGVASVLYFTAHVVQQRTLLKQEQKQHVFTVTKL